MSQPYLIIVSGPTASGKSTIENKTISYLSNNGITFKDRESVKVVIDDIIESESGYYRDWVKSKLSGVTLDQAIDMFNNPSNENLEEFSKSYFKARKSTDCVSGDDLNGPQHPDGYMLPGEGQQTCDKKNDKKLDDAIESGDNIVFETTGERDFSNWLVTDIYKYATKLKNKNYHIIYSYSLLDLDQLISRNKSRATKAIETWYGNEATQVEDPRVEQVEDPRVEQVAPKVPRLPDIRLFQYILNLMKIINIFLTNKELYVVGQAGVNTWSEVPYDAVPGIDKRLLIFDNSGEEGAVDAVYDSHGEWPMQNPTRIFKYFGMAIERDDLCGVGGWKEHINNMCEYSNPRHYPPPLPTHLNTDPVSAGAPASVRGGYNRRNKTRRNKTLRNKTRRNKTRRNKTRRNKTRRN